MVVGQLNLRKHIIPRIKKETYFKTCDTCRNRHKKHNSKKCKHGKRPNSCKDCDGGSICEHGRSRLQCVECDGTCICKHGKRRTYCKECDGAGLCEHSRQRSVCKECDGGSICKHKNTEIDVKYVIFLGILQVL